MVTVEVAGSEVSLSVAVIAHHHHHHQWCWLKAQAFLSPSTVGRPIMTGNQKDSYVGRGAEQANPTAVLDTTMGKIEVELFLDRVPRTASNFIDLARSGYYNGIHFHRVVPGCMDQFGCSHAKDQKQLHGGNRQPS